MTQDTKDVVARARAAFEEYAQFLTNNPNAEPSEFLPAVKQWADVTLGLMPELLDRAQSLSDRIDVLEAEKAALRERITFYRGAKRIDNVDEHIAGLKAALSRPFDGGSDNHGS